MMQIADVSRRARRRDPLRLHGGGFYDALVDGKVTFHQHARPNQYAGDAGGGVYNDSACGGLWSATDSHIAGNTAGSAGGGIFTSRFGTATLTNSRSAPTSRTTARRPAQSPTARIDCRTRLRPLRGMFPDALFGQYLMGTARLGVLQVMLAA